MGLVSVSLNGRPYDIACDDGQEGHVAYLADVLNSRVTALAETVGQVGESRLLLLAGLLVADELVEARNKLDQLTRSGLAEGASDSAVVTASGLTEAELAEMINGLAQRIEEIAERLKSA
ncbi:MAG TPA: cell division protein ZapA [Rhodospirillales bacterium]|jgi:cell division protein ZapA|nr:cell division protein ZapA [Rhodospirillales bacterium]